MRKGLKRWRVQKTESFVRKKKENLSENEGDEK